VLLNLLENAARYSPEGAPIAVTVSRATDNRVRVAVRDQGPGVAPDEQQRIFERFVRGAAAQSKGGLGIGLYLCRIIVEGHGGTLGIDSKPGAGAIFWFQLPAGP
jgi:two-component system, NtrC family, sensor histidine kinase KinB